MKARTIVILLLVYFAILFLFKGTEKTNEKLIDSLKLIIPITIIASFLYNWIREKDIKTDNSIPITNKEFEIPSRYNYMKSLDPNKPIDFGIKTVWIALKANSSEEVAKYLEFTKQNSVDWIEGTIRAYEGEIFITPPLDEWILIHGMGLPSPDSKFGNHESVELLNFLSNKYGEVFLFGNHRVSSVAFWSKSKNGILNRLYVVADGIGESIGEPSKLELKWNLIDLTPGVEAPNEDEWDGYLYPGEDEVIEMAKFWSINPMDISKLQNVEGKGIVGRMNNRL